MLIGACFDGSGINASDTLKNENFKPHPALKALLEWLAQARRRSAATRNAASRALSIYNAGHASNQAQVAQALLFLNEEMSMRQLLDTVWQRRGVSWVWDDEALQLVCAA